MPPAQLKVALACLSKANWKARTIQSGGKPVTVERGSFVVGVRGFAEYCGLSVQSLRTALKNLESTHFIARDPTTFYTMITVLNYDDWCAASPKLTQQSSQQLARDATPTNKGNNSNKGNKRTTTPPSEAALSVAQELYDAIRSHHDSFMVGAKPAAIEKKLLGWARDIDLGIRVDGHTKDGYLDAVRAAHRSEDEFWRGNILSGAKLRKHYERLQIKQKPTDNASKSMQNIRNVVEKRQKSKLDLSWMDGAR